MSYIRSGTRLPNGSRSKVYVCHAVDGYVYFALNADSKRRVPQDNVFKLTWAEFKFIVDGAASRPRSGFVKAPTARKRRVARKEHGQ